MLRNLLRGFRGRRLRELARHARSKIALRMESRALLAGAYRAGHICTVYDIGAHKGRWAVGMKRLMPKARFVLFEANPLHLPALAASKLEHHIAVLGAGGAPEVDFFSLPDDSGSTGGSIYKEKTEWYQDVEAVRLPASTLRSLVAEHDLPAPDFVKLDVQGAEMDVIEGGRELIAAANYLLLELPIIEYNIGAPKLDAYFSVAKDLGFLPIAIPEIHRHGPIVIQLDFLFVSRRLLENSTLGGLQL